MRFCQLLPLLTVEVAYLKHVRSSVVVAQIVCDDLLRSWDKAEHLSPAIAAGTTFTALDRRKETNVIFCCLLDLSNYL